MKKASIIIPVYNAPDVVSRLLDSIQKNTNWDFVEEVLIGDDNSDDLTAKTIAQYAESCAEFVHLRRSRNLGFLQNVNDLFARCNTDYVILLNSDVIVPPTWIERTIAALESEEEVVLACPLTTNATNLVLKPAPGQSWQDVDDILSESSPQYPECRPVVGFFLAIKRVRLGSGDLLDPIYASGYWEDTDLHFRVTSGIGRAVVIDNLFVFHQNESPSFSLENDLPKINDVNKKIFMERWGQEFIKMNELNSKFDHIKRFRLPDSSQFKYYKQSNIDVLFVLPVVKPGIGGIDVVMKLVDSLNLRGIKSVTYCYGEVNWNYVHSKYQHPPLTSIDDLHEAIAQTRAVFATSHDSFDRARMLARFYAAKLCYFVQGPEVAFAQGKFGRQISLDYQESDAIVTVSGHLTKYVQTFNANATTMPLGPSIYEYYPARNTNRDMMAIAACLRGVMKGTGVLVANLIAARAAGFKIHLFGSSRKWDIVPDATWHGFLNPKELRKLFSSVGYYMDCSYMEGLGLLPLEAAFCGSIPILAREQGLSGIVEPNVSYIRLPEDFPGSSFFEQIRSGSKEGMQRSVVELRSRVSQERATDEFSEFLGNLIAGKPWHAPHEKVYERTWHIGYGPTSSTPPKARSQLMKISKERDALRRERDAIYKSTSWRLSAPVRMAGKAFKRIAKQLREQ